MSVGPFFVRIRGELGFIRRSLGITHVGTFKIKYAHQCKDHIREPGSEHWLGCPPIRGVWWKPVHFEPALTQVNRVQKSQQPRPVARISVTRQAGCSACHQMRCRTSFIVASRKLFHPIILSKMYVANPIKASVCALAHCI
jgi:hypothetical protein